MDKRKTGIFLLIFLLGLIAGFLLSSAVRGHAAADTSGSRISGRQENVPLITTGEDSALPASPEQAAVSISARQAILTSGPSYPEWDKNTTYTGGDQVVCGGKIAPLQPVKKPGSWVMKYWPCAMSTGLTAWTWTGSIPG